MRFTGFFRGWFWHIFSEPLSRVDLTGLIGFAFGLVGWIIGGSSYMSHLGALASGMCLGQVVRDRQQRAHERRLAQQQQDHDAAMREIATMDFETLVMLSNQGDALKFRRCPRCDRMTYNPTDIKEGYCAGCHDWT